MKRRSVRRTVQLLLFVTALTALGCNSKEYDRMVDEVRELQSELQELGTQKSLLYEKKSESDRLISRFSQLQREESQHLIELDEIDEYKRELEATVKYLDSQLSIWIPATQRSLVGVSLGTIRTADGTILVDAVVTRLDSFQVELQHREGSQTVELAALDEPVRKRLLHEETVVLSSEVQD